MRRLAASILVAAMAIFVATPAAQADTPRCVSRHEYGRVVKGMTMTKVHAIFDTAGDKTGLGAPNQLYYYQTCTGRGMVQVIYTQRGRVVSKDARFF
jgi:uncharacterized membrane protein